MGFEQLIGRLRRGRPLVLDADVCASLRARGVDVDVPGSLGALVRSRPQDVLEHHRREIHSRVDVISALTSDTTPRALAEVGMQHRSAMLTGNAIELALDAAAESHRPIGVAGVLGSDMLGPLAPERMREEFTEHAQRLATSGCELVVARGQGSALGLLAAVSASHRAGLVTWAVVECNADAQLIAGSLREAVAVLGGAGASAVLFEVPNVDEGVSSLAAASSQGSVVLGVLLAASPLAVRGFPVDGADPHLWAAEAMRLEAAGARIIGGGAGTTESHTTALATNLGALHPSIVPPPQSSDLIV
jgi:methionine synthase I (cobalamin-dependent)